MKLQIMSDLHLEMEEFLPVNAGSDVLVLAGDICLATYFTRPDASPYYEKAQSVLQFFKHCSENWKDVIYLMGNHEHYHGRFNDTEEILRTHISDAFPNVHFLENSTVNINGVHFVGGTLWTSVDDMNPLSVDVLKSRMNDYRVVDIMKDGIYRKLSPADTARTHKRTVAYIQETVQNMPNEKVVVVTHHLPSYRSVHSRYHNDPFVNHGYYSDLDYIMEENHNIEMWIHGHTHSSFDYKVGHTQVVCNPKGYGNENKEFSPNTIYEVK